MARACGVRRRNRARHLDVSHRRLVHSAVEEAEEVEAAVVGAKCSLRLCRRHLSDVLPSHVRSFQNFRPERTRQHHGGVCQVHRH